ncbi:MAG TPA: UPF0758 domain-containing protein, partial [Casimicrobiaceae bacterium]|nr:UPF0758 domain-containing protein [Casimicrobiaceae bacterium]
MPLSCGRSASRAPVALARVRRDEGPERPRERLAALGAAALTDAELLAVVLGTGARGASALDLARGALARHGGL